MKTCLIALAAILLSVTGASARGAYHGADDIHLRLSTSSTGSGRSLVAEAEAHLGEGNFTALHAAWCARAVSEWLKAIGRKPLNSDMASAALVYGPLELHPNVGDLVVIATRRGRYGHVGIVVADLGSEVEIISGNWGNRVSRAKVSRRSVTAFVKV